MPRLSRPGVGTSDVERVSLISDAAALDGTVVARMLQTASRFKVAWSGT